MNRKHILYLLFLVFIFNNSCSTGKYIHDPSSKKRQKELRKHRSGNVFKDIGLSMASVFVLAAVDVDLDLYPEANQFKKLKLINPTSDTIFVNMLADVYWDEENYCDFMDIRIPPHSNCKVLVPTDANYNLYFSNTQESEDDEKINFYTNGIKKISLYPGLTLNNDTINLNQTEWKEDPF
jgi:hypothetical protein